MGRQTGMKCQFTKIFIKGDENAVLLLRPGQYIWFSAAWCISPDPKDILN